MCNYKGLRVGEKDLLLLTFMCYYEYVNVDSCLRGASYECYDRDK